MTTEETLARDFQRAAQGGATVEEFLKAIAAKLADEVRLWERSGNPTYQQEVIDSCHRRIGFILSDELGMASIQSMRVSLSYESWITVSIPHGDGEIVGSIHIGVNPVWWEVCGWEWKRFDHREEF